MHHEIQNAANKLGLVLRNIAEASERTRNNLEAAKQAVSEALCPNPGDDNPDCSNQCLDIVLCGSFGRQEVTQQSDFDYLIVAHEVVDDPDLILAFRDAAEKAERELGLATAGRTGIFGGLVSAAEMVDRIGLEDDTNADLTHRLVLLEESVPLLNEERHRKLIRVILERYLIEYRKAPKRGVPRFLLNDVVRYWRTIAVDYQAKRWRKLDQEKAGLRYFKLRSSRKLAFAGTLIALFMPRILDQAVTVELLYKQFSMPPLARLAQLHAYLPESSQALEALRALLVIADRVIQYLDDESVRNQWKTVSDIAPEAKRLTERLQNNLQILFTSECALTGSPTLSSNSAEQVTLRHLHDKYLVF